ncbi:MAG TPA: AraC family transcriptional regulator [Rhizomicrobium sp.]
MFDVMAPADEACPFADDLLSKQSRAWTGGEALLLARRGRGERTDFNHRSDRHAIALHIEGANTTLAVRRNGGQQQLGGCSLGQVMTIPAHHAVEGWSDFPQEYRHVVVLLDTRMVDDVLEGENLPATPAFAYCRDIGDGAIAGRMHEVQMEIDNPGLMGRLYVESLCCEIAVRAVRRQAAAPLATARGGLTPRRLRMVKDYIESNFVSDITLSDLAAVAGVSYAHFCRAFHTSVGMASHQYIVRRRIEMAKDLLANSNLPIAEIAPTVGFGDQSHLTKHFRRIVGTTPRQFRNAA